MKYNELDKYWQRLFELEWISLRGEPFGTPAATKMWKEKIDFQLESFGRLKEQLQMSKREG